MSNRFPKLSAAKGAGLLKRMIESDTSVLEHDSRTLPDLQTERFAATGLPKVNSAYLLKLQATLNEVMRENGYPKPGLPIRQAVDRALAKELALADLPIGEMLQADTWTWIGLNLLPHYVRWRWGGVEGSLNPRRVCGPILRNALGRLWLRAVVLDKGHASPDRWQLLEALTEDASVAILERTSISSDWRLTRIIVAEWTTLTEGLGTAASERLLRDAIVRIRIQMTLLEVGGLTDEYLESLIRDAMLSGLRS
ncbi:hypothetical protein [Stenotrophomonas forensis]